MIYKTADTTCVQHDNTLTSGYYIFSCTGANACTFVANNSAGLGAIASGSENLLVYNYDSESGEFTQIKNNQYYYSLNSDVKRLVECSKGSDFITSNGKCTIVTTGVFMNPGTDSTATPATLPIIKVTTNVAVASAATMAVSNAKSYYIDESSKIDGGNYYARLIECSSTTSCKTVDPIPGTFIDEGSRDGSNHYLNIITCTEDSCSTKAVITGVYINSAVSGSVTNALIHYKTNTLEAFDGVANEFYLNASDGSLIKCTSNGCGSVDALTEGVYLDKGTENSGYVNVIQCTSETTCSVTDAKVKLADNSEVDLAAGNVFLNAGVTSGKANAIISCSGDTVKCSAVSAPAEGYYVDTINSATNVIECTSTGCSSKEGVTGTAYGYKDALDTTNKSMITFNSNEFKSDKGTATLSEAPVYYINAADPTKVIKCVEDNGVCSDETYSLTGKKYEFFDHTGGVIITCSSTGCVASKGK